MPELGEKLREAREGLGLSVNKVGEKINIKDLYIQAMEEENFSALPDKGYAVEILKSYAVFLDLDPGYLISQFNKAWADAGTAKAYIKETFAKQKRLPEVFTGNKKLMLGVGILAFVLFFLIGIMNNLGIKSTPAPDNSPQTISSNQTDQGQAVVSEKIPDPNVESLPAKNSEEVPSGNEAALEKQTEIKNAAAGNAKEVGKGLKLEISATKGDCWLEVAVDGERVLYRTVPQGATPYLFEGDEEIKVVFGNAAAVDVIYNGAELGSLGEAGQVVRKTFVP